MAREILLLLSVVPLACWPGDAGPTGGRRRHGASLPGVSRVAGPTASLASITEHRVYGHDEIAFSPDGRLVAYLYRDSTVRRPADPRARAAQILTDEVSLRWLEVASPDVEASARIASADWRPEGRFEKLRARLRISPDSRRALVVCAGALTTVDLSTREARRIAFDGEAVGGGTFRSAEELVYSTFDGRRRAFWRQRVDGEPDERRLVAAEEAEAVPLPGGPDGRPVPPCCETWAPDGRTVVFASSSGEGTPTRVLSLDSGRILPLPVFVSMTEWTADGGRLVLQGSASASEWRRRTVLVVDAATLEVRDLGPELGGLFGPAYEVEVDSLPWTLDGEHLIVVEHLGRPSPSAAERLRSHLLRLGPPLAVELSRDRFIRSSPLPGWLLLQGEGDGFDWLDPATGRMVPLAGWPNGWLWAPGGRLAAEIRDGRVVLRRVAPP